MKLTVATLNLGDGPDDRKAAALDRLVEQGVDVICLQEASDRRAMLRAWASANDWVLHHGDTPGAGAVPILFREGLPVTETASREAVPRTFVGPGAGPDTSKPKVVTSVRLEDGEQVLNTHLTPSATRPWAWRRRRHYRRHIAVLKEMVENRERGRIILVGDFNAPPTFRLLKPLLRLGMVQATPDATMGRRLIDHTWIKRGRVVSARVLEVPSDHRAVIVTVAP